MSDFFTARVEEYDMHMLTEVKGCKEAYIEMAKLVPDECEFLLDLGCGTGLELDEIFKLHPNVVVTGIDLTQAMLDKLKEKHPLKKMNLFCGSYFDIDLGEKVYDGAISFETMHHFSHERKISLYKKIYNCLKDGRIYVECDYMVENQAEEDLCFSENARIRKDMNISKNEYYHYDTPCTIDNQISMLKKAGFSRVENTFRIENTTIVVAYK
ncbi:MAG TPA: class I SAM-dependent methyltransferase [Bacillota bacterium]|nr:class I SAM-dependent methyltransferase [Bacillota bacterium]